LIHDPLSFWALARKTKKGRGAYALRPFPWWNLGFIGCCRQKARSYTPYCRKIEGVDPATGAADARLLKVGCVNSFFHVSSYYPNEPTI
jgi:hypothetical protein